MARKLYTARDERRVREIVSPLDKKEKYRTPWRRDYARLIHSSAFRRLQGKTQLFPSEENDFFRNRLTHSLEVAQVAKSIAIKINDEVSAFKKQPIDTDLVETAALAHDLGHPPFGHNGEKALDRCMANHGGFEGNAQTLRILSKLEKRQTKQYFEGAPLKVVDGGDERIGLNLAYRTLAGVLKYDRQIPREAKDRDEPEEVSKRYYYTEADLVKQIRQHVGATKGKELKTIECSIMDVADDIAYSTYDLEDAFKGGLLNPISIIAYNRELVEKVATKVRERLIRYYPTRRAHHSFDVKLAYNLLYKVFSEIYDVDVAVKRGKLPSATVADVASEVTARAVRIAHDAYSRTKVTAQLVGQFIQAIDVEVNPQNPALSTVKLNIKTFKLVEVLKNIAYEALIMSSRLKVAEHRGQEIVARLFEKMNHPQGYLLMPDDCREMYLNLREPDERKRVVCDFIAGMTDRYAIQLFNRLAGTNRESILAPL